MVGGGWIDWSSSVSKEERDIYATRTRRRRSGRFVRRSVGYGCEELEIDGRRRSLCVTGGFHRGNCVV